MDTRVFSAYNLARGVLLNSRLSLADSGNKPLKLLDIVVSGMGMDPTTGLWLTPLHAIPAVPRVFPFDLIYLDKEYRVVATTEMGPDVQFPPFQPEVSSALVLPPDIVRSTGTVVGDRLIVCLATELQALLAPVGTEPPKAGIPEAPPKSVVATRANGKGPKPAVIELSPEKFVPHASPRDSSGSESPSLGAEGKTDIQPRRPVKTEPAERLPAPAEVVSAVQDSADLFGSRSSGSYPPGPSMDISEVVLERARKVPAPIIEHRIDPEDLFSNWVVTSPPAPTSRIEQQSPPADVPAMTPASPVRNGKQSTTRPAGSERSEKTEMDQAKADPTAESAAIQPKARTALNRSEKPSTKAKQSPEKTGPPAPSRIANSTPHSVPATTFTAAPYGMWQVSMPTAVAPTGALPKAVPRAQTSQGPLRSGEKTESVPTLATGQITPPVPDVKTDLANSQARNLKSQISNEERPRPAADLRGKEFEPAPKAVAIAPDAVQKHTPGDFVASLQEKLQRVQHSKPESAPPSPPLPTLETAASSISPALQPSNRVSEPAPSQLARPDQAVRSKFLSPSEADQSPSPGKRAADLPAAPAPQPRPEKAKPDSSTSSFRTRFKQWFNPISTPSDRRRAGRRYVPGMVAHYFTGGAPKPHEVADISMSGMYVLTDDRWMPGTMIQMTLQKPCAHGERKQSMNVLSRIVRRGSDGVAAEFVMSETLSHVSHDIQPSQATDKFALARFL